MKLELNWHKYRYFPYEKELANREVKALLKFEKSVESGNGLRLENVKDSKAARKLTYFESYVNGNGIQRTTQSEIESETLVGRRRQSTRYSVHGLHEYKGKFNPQVARALLNIFDAGEGKHILDPFCGSGTTLVEAARLGAHAYGTDLNPLAVLIANAKIISLRTDFSKLRDHFLLIKRQMELKFTPTNQLDERSTYLEKWFEKNVLNEIECVRFAIEREADDLAPVFKVIGSNLIRDYSMQDPRDLRIRRRTSPIPEKPFKQAFYEACEAMLVRIHLGQKVMGVISTDSSAAVRDNTTLRLDELAKPFDCAVTSPPYATALPYIDTQRLSLVWLGMISPKEVAALESELIGSRELRGKMRQTYSESLENNGGNLPSEQADYCLELRRSLGENDGFRRKAVPPLLYRYFCTMKSSMKSTLGVLRPGAKYALIVGHNHTTLGGKRFDIDTPSHLANIATSVGWRVEEIMPLQAYQRYDGYHVGNAVAAESLIVLQKRIGE